MGFMVAKTDRHDAIRQLRRQGLTVGDIASKIGCSRQTVWRHSKGIEPVPPAPTPSPTPDSNGHKPLDLEAAQSLGLGVLVQRAQAGSVSAAAHVFKATSAEIRANRCQDHIPKDDVIAALFTQYDLWRSNLKGVFIRRIELEFDVDPARIENLVDDAIDAITRELNARFEAASEAEDNQNHG